MTPMTAVISTVILALAEYKEMVAGIVAVAAAMTAIGVIVTKTRSGVKRATAMVVEQIREAVKPDLDEMQSVITTMQGSIESSQGSNAEEWRLEVIQRINDIKTHVNTVRADVNDVKGEMKEFKVDLSLVKSELSHNGGKTVKDVVKNLADTVYATERRTGQIHKHLVEDEFLTDTWRKNIVTTIEAIEQAQGHTGHNRTDRTDYANHEDNSHEDIGSLGNTGEGAS